jgi:twitching motility protein PilT
MQIDEKLVQLLQHVKKENASDLHLRCNDIPYLRLKGELIAIEQEVFTAAELFTMLTSCLSEKQINQWKSKKSLDFSLSVPGTSRFRVNLFLQKGTPAAVFRQIPFQIPDIETLDIPDTVRDLIKFHSGLLLVTGPTGSGKSTTIASMINWLNTIESKRIVTLEDPIEFLFRDEKSDIVQREIGHDLSDFAKGLKAVLRQDPDIIFVGEMRNLETIDMALTAAETGHLVVTTLHTSTAVETISRIISAFPYETRDYVKDQLASVLIGSVCQKLVPLADRTGLVAVREIMVANQAVSNAIRGNNISQIQLAIESGKKEGMITFDQALQELLKKKLITFDDAVSRAVNPDRFFKMFRD